MPLMTPLRAYALSITPRQVPPLLLTTLSVPSVCRECGGRTYKGRLLCIKCERRSRPLWTPEERSQRARKSAHARWGDGPQAPKPKTGHRAGDHTACELDARHGACSECGKTVQVSPTSASPERRRCRECQRKNPRRPRPAPFMPQGLTCPTCGGAFTQQRYGQKYCCIEHRPPRPGTRTAGRVAASRRRRLRVATTWDGVTDAEILERDRWMCGICHRRIGKSFRYPHPRSASVDHVVPLSQGGDDTAANKRAAHFGCNVQRGNRGGGEQLALVG